MGLLVDLSSLESISVNAAIEPEVCSLQNLQIDDVTQEIVKLDLGSELIQMDIKSAY